MDSFLQGLAMVFNVQTISNGIRVEAELNFMSTQIGDKLMTDLMSTTPS
ncbi:MAG: hypothetical protein HRU39_19035, partial [Salinicola sp.]|nr:hypothetical protein [Salinicola sp.]